MGFLPWSRRPILLIAGLNDREESGSHGMERLRSWATVHVAGTILGKHIRVLARNGEERGGRGGSTTELKQLQCRRSERNCGKNLTVGPGTVIRKGGGRGVDSVIRRRNMVRRAGLSNILVGRSVGRIWNSSSVPSQSFLCLAFGQLAGPARLIGMLNGLAVPADTADPWNVHIGILAKDGDQFWWRRCTVRHDSHVPSPGVEGSVSPEPGSDIDNLAVFRECVQEGSDGSRGVVAVSVANCQLAWIIPAFSIKG
jgi:hypothetical protein